MDGVKVNMSISEIMISNAFHADNVLSRIYFKLGSFETDKDEPKYGIEKSLEIIKQTFTFAKELIFFLDSNGIEYVIYPVLYIGNVVNRIDFILPITNAQQAVLLKIKFPFLDLTSFEQKIDNKFLEDFER